MCVIGLFSVMLMLFYAGYVTGKTHECERFEKRIKHGIMEVGGMVYFCTAPYMTVTTRVRNATPEEVESVKHKDGKEGNNENPV